MGSRVKMAATELDTQPAKETENEEEMKDVDEVVAGQEDGRKTIYNVVGTIFRAHRFGIYASFEHEGQCEIGVLFPGKSFVNAVHLLGDVVQSDQELELLFPPGTEVSMDLVSQVSRLVPESGSSLGCRS